MPTEIEHAKTTLTNNCSELFRHINVACMIGNYISI